jgi:hypothetical protein
LRYFEARWSDKSESLGKESDSCAASKTSVKEK